MSVTAHLTEQFILKKHFPKLNFKWLLLGAYFPDGWGLDRIFMMFDVRTHRDICFGWTHSLTLPVLLALPVYFIFGRWAFVSFVFSMLLHVATDTFDSLGVMLFWPFDSTKYSLDFFPWYDKGTLTDLYGYYTAAAPLLFESFFLVWAVGVIYKEGRGKFWRGVRSFWKAEDWKDKEELAVAPAPAHSQP